MLGQSVCIRGADMNLLPWIKSRLRVGIYSGCEQNSYVSIPRLHLPRAQARRCLLKSGGDGLAA
jgi:hypothetical protein